MRWLKVAAIKTWWLAALPCELHGLLKIMSNEWKLSVFVAPMKCKTLLSHRGHADGLTTSEGPQVTALHLDCLMKKRTDTGWWQKIIWEAHLHRTAECQTQSVQLNKQVVPTLKSWQNDCLLSFHVDTNRQQWCASSSNSLHSADRCYIRK